MPGRVLGVARWNPDTALAIVHEAGTGTILVATVVSIVTFAIEVAMLAIGFAVAFVPMSRRARVLIWLVGVPLALVLLFVPEDVWVIGGAWLFSPLLRLMGNTGDDRASRYFRRAVTGGLVVICGVGLLGVLFGLFIGDQPLVPGEALRLPDGSVHYGYVLDDGSDTVLLRADSMLVEHLPGPPVSRAICRLRPTRERQSLVARIGIGSSHEYPRCTESLVR